MTVQELIDTLLSLPDKTIEARIVIIGEQGKNKFYPVISIDAWKQAVFIEANSSDVNEII